MSQFATLLADYRHHREAELAFNCDTFEAEDEFNALIDVTSGALAALLAHPAEDVAQAMQKLHIVMDMYDISSMPHLPSVLRELEDSIRASAEEIVGAVPPVPAERTSASGGAEWELTPDDDGDGGGSEEEDPAPDNVVELRPAA